MAKKPDTKAAVRAAAKSSGVLFDALEDQPRKSAPRGAKRKPQAPATPVKAAKPATRAAKPAARLPKGAQPAPKPTQNEEIPIMTDTQTAPAIDLNAAAENMRQMFDGKTVIERSQKLAQEAAELARGNVEAMAASARITAQNAGTLGQDVAEVGRKGFEGATEAMKSFAEAKTPAELLRLQGEFAKSYMETMIAEGTRLTETMVKLTGEAMEPVQSRFAAAAEKARALSSN